MGRRVDVDRTPRTKLEVVLVRRTNCFLQYVVATLVAWVFPQGLSRGLFTPCHVDPPFAQKAAPTEE